MSSLSIPCLPFMNAHAKGVQGLRFWASGFEGCWVQGSGSGGSGGKSLKRQKHSHSQFTKAPTQRIPETGPIAENY